MDPRRSTAIRASLVGLAAALSAAGCGGNVLTVGYQHTDVSDADSGTDASPADAGKTDSRRGGEAQRDAVADQSAESDIGGDEESGPPPSSDATADAGLEADGGLETDDGPVADGGLEADSCVPNACGGCGALDAGPQSPCGECGQLACDGNGASLVCDDPAEVRQISAGFDHTCAVVGSGGRLRCWGWNNVGQLGNGTQSQVPRLAPPTTDLLTGVRQIAAGADHTCILTGAGGLRCWGGNIFGQLADPA